jgi:hypothetical protein
MARRKRSSGDGAPCRETGQASYGRGCGRATCPGCEPRIAVTPSGYGLKSHKAFLSPRTSEAKWLRTASPYTWPLAWQVERGHAKLPEPFKPETAEQVRARQLRAKPTLGGKPYPWKMWYDHKPASEQLKPSAPVAVPADITVNDWPNDADLPAWESEVAA